jgi:hypothetical protein
LPAATAAAFTATGCRAGVGPERNVDGFGLASEQHDLTALRIELDDHVGHLIDDPDIVLRVDADLIGEHEAIHVMAEFFDETAIAVELEELRTAMHEVTRAAQGHEGMTCTGVDEDVATGILATPPTSPR